MNLPVTRDHHPDAPPSALPRIALCPGSMTLVKKAPPQAASEDADEGTLLHAHLPPDVPLDDLDEEQQAAVKWAREHVNRCFHGAVPEYEIPCTLFAFGIPVTWGTIDAGLKDDRHGIIYELKSGRLGVQREAVELQGECYAGAFMQKMDCDSVEVWIGCPRTKTEFHGVYANPNQIAMKIVRIMEHARTHPEEYHPSATACRYCRAQVICPAFKKEILEELPMLRERLAVLEPEHFPAILEKLPILERFIHECRDRARDLITMGYELPGYVLREVVKRKIVDVEAAFRAASCLEQSEFLKCCEIGLGKLEKAYENAAIKAGEAKTKSEAKDNLALGLLRERALEVKTVRQLTRKETE